MSSTLSSSFRALTLSARPARTFSSGAVRLEGAAEPVASSSAAPATAAPTWAPGTHRTGVLARKAGMTCLWDPEGNRVPVTVLHLDDVEVLSSQSYPATSTTPAHHSVIVGCSPRKVKTTGSALLGQFQKAGVDPKMRIAEFRITEDAVVQPGTSISAAHFVPGQHVDVQAPSIGKGFQGVMKRHNFAGLRATHGTSISHRSHGSTGQHQDPGRVFPGKKMAGRMGGLNVTTQNLLVHRIDSALNVIYVKGAVPGPPGGFVRVTDAKKKVQWRSMARKAKGLGLEEGEVLEGVKGLPMPVGSKEMAKAWPREVEVGPKRVVKASK